MRLAQRLRQLTRQLQSFQFGDRGPFWKRSRSPIVCVLTVVLLTSGLGHRFYNAPILDIGKAAPQTIYAPASAAIEDPKATEEKRKTARKDSISVLTLDQEANRQISQALRRQLDQGRELRQQAGSLPFVPTSMLSLRTQSYLRQAQEEDWQKILSALNAVLPQSSQNAPNNNASNNNASNKADGKSSQRSGEPLNGEQQQGLGELKFYRQTTSAEAYVVLLQAISQARSNYSTALNSLPQSNPSAGRQLYNAAFLELTDKDWDQIQVKASQIAEQMLMQGISPGLPESLLQDAVKLQVRDRVPKDGEQFATALLLNSLQPNLVRDEDQTRLRAEKAAQGVKPEMVEIQQGEVIVREGDMIRSGDFALLDHFSLSRRGIDWLGLFSFGALVSGAVVIYWVVEQRSNSKLRQRDRLLICLLALTPPLMLAFQVPSTNLPAVGMLVGAFYGLPLGITVTGLLTALLPFGVSLDWSHMLSSAAAGLLCGAIAGRMRSREELAWLGAAVGVLQGTLYLVLNVASGLAWYTLLGSTAIHGLLGLAWCIMAIGISPYLEQVFDLVTTIRLVELANPNRPLLKRMAAQAPGTFQHTLFVATLAEAAARDLGCNVELVRTGTLYHDIGKMHDPLGFIENQMGGPNKHDLIDDPWESAEIIRKHVTEGLVMARKFRLPKAVQAFIPEHQGTMLIAYFYYQAKQRLEQNPNPDGTVEKLKDADFRYAGPAPQSRETGIVMLADSCEAALRSLKDATTEEALAMINKILRARWQDNQLTKSGLTRGEMSKIATIFVEVWQQSNHQRIAYPKLSASVQPSTV